MFKTIRNGFLFGLGFCVACTTFFLVSDFIVNRYWDNDEDKKYTKLVIDNDYLILNKSHRIKINSLGSKSLYIVGELGIRKKMDESTIEITATLRDKAGGFIDECWKYIEPENIERFSFKIHCSDISEENQFQSYTLKVAYHESV